MTLMKKTRKKTHASPTGRQNKKFPSAKQWKQFFRVLNEKEKIAFSALIIIAIISAVFLGVGFYFKNTITAPDFGGEYKEGIVGQPMSLNPLRLSNQDVDRDLVEVLFSGLLKYDGNGTLVNDLAEDSTTEESSVVQQEGGRTVKRQIKTYNLDAIIALGYRVNSQRATQFRVWATKILKDYLLQGYTVNEKRLLEVKNKFNQLKETINFLQKKSKTKLLKGQSEEILNLLSDYSKTLSLLEKYDKKKLKSEKGIKARFVLEYENCLEIISELKKNLMAKKQAGDIFGNEIDKKFESAVKSLYQTFDGKELYKSIEDKASHLLYLTTLVLRYGSSENKACWVCCSKF